MAPPLPPASPLHPSSSLPPTPPPRGDAAATPLPRDLSDEPSWYLHRPRLDVLLERLQSPNARVLALWDAAGSGKTTLMAAWARRMQALNHPVHWFSGRDLGGGRTVRAALPGLAVERQEPDAGLRRFVFIDDLHLAVATGPRAPNQPFGPKLTDVLDGLSGSDSDLRFVVSGRYRPVSGTAPLEASGALIECPDDTLAFTLDETFALAGHQRVPLSQDDGATLWRHTGGWATALALAMTRTAEGENLDLRRFDGDNRAVADYLGAEIVTGLDEADREVLLRSAVGEVVPLDLAVAVTERPDAGDVLERLARRNTLIGREPDADGSQDYRYHPILLAYLQAEGRRRDSSEAAARHAQASRWYADRADGAAALTQSLQASDPDVVVEMLERYGLGLALAGETDLVGRALGRVQRAPAEPATLAMRLLLLAPHFPARRRVHQLFDAADGAITASRKAGPVDPGLTRWAAVVDILHALQATEGTDVENRLHSVRTGSVSFVRGDPAVDLLAATAEGRCLDRLGQPQPAEETLREVAETARVAGFEWLFLVATDLAATAAGHGGNWLHVAMLESQMAASRAAGRAADDISSRAMLYAMIERYERCLPLDPLVLDELAAVGATQSDAGVSVPAQVLALLAQLSATPTSRQALDRLTLLMREVGAEHPRALSLCCVPLIEVSGALDGRAETQVLVRLVERVLGEDSLEALLLRFLLVPPTRAGHPAEERLKTAAVDERTAWRGSSIVSAWVALAHVADVSGRHVESDTRLLRALRLASQFGAERAFLHRGGQGIGLVKARVGRLGDLDEFARQILQRAADARVDQRPATAERALNSPVLTQREREVLRELPYHQSVLEIARKRNVSPNTVKTHLRNIYQKLDAKNRADAVVIAQDRGLL